jgi:hypothetical protein
MSTEITDAAAAPAATPHDIIVTTLTWFPVSARLPDAFISVLVFTLQDGVFMAWYDDSAKTWIDCATGAQPEDDVLYWAQDEGPIL